MRCLTKRPDQQLPRQSHDADAAQPLTPVKTLLDANERLDEAIELARTGLRLGPSPDMAPMGHYLLADIFTRLGRTREAERERSGAGCRLWRFDTRWRTSFAAILFQW